MQVTVDTLGAQIMSIRSADGLEYLWQGDSRYWAERSPLLFPLIGRLYGQRYTYAEKEYTLPIHGFASKMEFEAAQRTPEAITFSLESNEETLKCYPFPFILSVTFLLEGSTLRVCHRVCNTGTETMYFGLGGHPGMYTSTGRNSSMPLTTW